jgi:hypothetical protein
VGCRWRDSPIASPFAVTAIKSLAAFFVIGVYAVTGIV